MMSTFKNHSKILAEAVTRFHLAVLEAIFIKTETIFMPAERVCLFQGCPNFLIKGYIGLIL